MGCFSITVITFCWEWAMGIGHCRSACKLQHAHTESQKCNRQVFHFPQTRRRSFSHVFKPLFLLCLQLNPGDWKGLVFAEGAQSGPSGEGWLHCLVPFWCFLQQLPCAHCAGLRFCMRTLVGGGGATFECSALLPFCNHRRKRLVALLQTIILL